VKFTFRNSRPNVVYLYWYVFGPFLLLFKMRKLQSQKSQGVRGNVDGAGRAGGGDPALREAKKAELATWLASEIEVRTWKSLPSRGYVFLSPPLQNIYFGGLQVMSYV